MSVYTALYGATYGGQAFPLSPLDLECQLYLGGAWTDVTSYAYQREGTSPAVNITRGRPDERSTATAAWAASATGGFSVDAMVQLQAAGTSGNWTGDIRHQAVTSGGTASQAGFAGSATKDSTVSEAFAVTLQLSSAATVSGLGSVSGRVA